MIKRIAWLPADGEVKLIEREWLVTNGRGGYSSGTLSGAATRRYHGLLIAALPAPLGRTVMLNHLSEELRFADGQVLQIGCHEYPEHLHMPCTTMVQEFALEDGLPVWRYTANGLVIEKRVLMPHTQNTSIVRYRILEGDAHIRLQLRPSVHFRAHEDPVSAPLYQPYTVRIVGQHYELAGDPIYPSLRLRVYGNDELPSFVIDSTTHAELLYRVEAGRGYASRGSLWSPGYFRADLRRDHDVALAASVEDWDVIEALDPASAWSAETERRSRLLALAVEPARAGVNAELVLAADHFLITPSGRQEDAARARAAGEELRTVIAGYHWFTDWGRDTMISLEGLTLCTGRSREAAYVLRTFAHYVKDGLIPNMFPDHAIEGLYHTTDATLWYFHAIDRYFTYTSDLYTLEFLLPTLHDIVEHHLRGTRFGIGVDPNDGLLRQGAPGYQLTWMDAKVEDWVVTPRRGKPVEINALWYNALRLLESWTRLVGAETEADRLGEHANQAYESFNRRFWYDAGGYLYDVVDGEHGDDPACRPNQLFAISLRHAVLEEARWESMFDVVRKRLLTPVGLRSLAPGHPDYKPTYDGDLRSRDAAYHQGTVWAWLIGPFIDAALRVHPEQANLDELLDGFNRHLGEFGVGSIAEIFDAEPPFTPRGCIAQAWSVAEVLRARLRAIHAVPAVAEPVRSQVGSH
jgi:predicted glycogen debranching enzyme